MITNKYNITKLQNACENSAAEDVDLTITGWRDGVILRGGLTGHNNHNIPSTHSPAPGSFT